MLPADAPVIATLFVAAFMLDVLALVCCRRVVRSFQIRREIREAAIILRIRQQLDLELDEVLELLARARR